MPSTSAVAAPSTAAAERPRWHLPATAALNVALGWPYTLGFALAYGWIAVEVFGATPAYSSDPEFALVLGQVSLAALVVILVGANLAWQGVVTGFRARLWAVAVPAFLLPSFFVVVLPELGRAG